VQPHRPFHVIPFAENVQFALNMILPGKEHSQPLPKLERLKKFGDGLRISGRRWR
jgi:hypothetical protein